MKKRKTEEKEKELLRLQLDCGLSDLELFQIQDQQRIAEDQRVLRKSVEELEEKKRINDCTQHFDDVFLPSLSASTSLNFEQFCVMIMRGVSKTCGICATYRTKRYHETNSMSENKKSYEEDPLFDFCPHLICTEWWILPKLRSISKVFWNRFIQSRAGRATRICFPRCFGCTWTNLYGFGSSQKVHETQFLSEYDRIRYSAEDRSKFTIRLRLPFGDKFGGMRIADTSANCFCKSLDAAKYLQEWCKKANCDTFVEEGKDGEREPKDRVQILRCNCFQV